MEYVGYSMIEQNMGGSMGIPNSWLVDSGKSQSKMDESGVPPFQETSM